MCKVPDYATNEVADHAMALALAWARQLPATDRRVRGGAWKIVPDVPMPSFEEMWFVVMGFGRIARKVITRAQAFGFRTAYNPYVAADDCRAAGVESVSKAEALSRADILSLHLPLSENTRHAIDAPELGCMKPSAILINTSRGSLINSEALVKALQQGQIFAAGLNVFESEPIEKHHPLLQCANTLLTSHTAWYSSSSILRLQRMAAEEAVRGPRGLPLRNQVNVKK